MVDPEQQVRDWLNAYASPQACVAHLLCDRHERDRVAVTEVGSDLSAHALTYGDLAERSTALAQGLAGLGVGAGDAVATLLGPGIDLTVTAVAVWRLGAALVPLTTALAASAIGQRLRETGARVVVCQDDQHPKVAAETGARVVTTGARHPGAHTVAELSTAPGPETAAVAVGADAPLVLLYTAGVSGPPRGVRVPVRALAALHAHHRYGLKVSQDDVYWCAGEPGDAHGLYYGLVSPLLAGHTAVQLRAGFDPELTLDVMEIFQVTSFAATPAVYRALRSTTKTLPPEIVVQRLASTGEALHPDVIAWAQGVFGVGICDHYGQPETGVVAVSDAGGGALRALPGFHVRVLAEMSDTENPPGVFGRVAIDTASSPALWFGGYLNDTFASRRRFSPDGRWYLTGDTGSRDASGGIHLLRRDSDVILTSGYRVGPYDVESVLLEHPAVAEAAVYGVPDDARGAAVAAHVVLHQTHPADADLADELRALVRAGVAEHAAPTHVTFVPHLPRTASGKLRRNRLRAAAP